VFVDTINPMKSFEYDLGYLQAGLDVIEDYLLSDDVFWPLCANPPASEPDYPRLTLGGLLLAKERLKTYPATHSQGVQREQVISDLDQIRSKWRVAWENKAGRSFSARLRMWRDFIEEYQMSPHDNADRYKYEVRLRVMITLLISESKRQQQADVDLLSGLDEYLKSVLEMDGFLWEPEIQTGFPANTYWYLYGFLPPAAKQQ
jgi:hypothetical protein